MGYPVVVLEPDGRAPAARFADKHLCAPFDDKNALAELAQCAAVTTEFENVNADAMRDLAAAMQVSPSSDCVAIAQNRIWKIVDSQGGVGNRALSCDSGCLGYFVGV